MRIRLLDEVRALRAVFPDADAMRDLPVSALAPEPFDEDDEVIEYWRALRHLRDEMLLVRAGGAVDLTVLDDEIACVERLPHQ